MRATAELLASLEAISNETTRMLAILDDPETKSSQRREIKRRVVQIRETTHALIEWLAEAALEERVH
ncbi:MAG TPA: hypothetical protein VHL59_08840 [Thermoanaerobaculia bacterium]|nr:hypothetical protein [Thermoanaerobaculia bacterium]